MIVNDKADYLRKTRQKVTISKDARKKKANISFGRIDFDDISDEYTSWIIKVNGNDWEYKKTLDNYLEISNPTKKMKGDYLVSFENLIKLFTYRSLKQLI